MIAKHLKNRNRTELLEKLNSFGFRFSQKTEPRFFQRINEGWPVVLGNGKQRKAGSQSSSSLRHRDDLTSHNFTEFRTEKQLTFAMQIS